ncbi:MAG: TonB-dependent receptor plug domain-containing protein [Verrucomicrobiota bacterium]
MRKTNHIRPIPIRFRSKRTAPTKLIAASFALSLSLSPYLSHAQDDNDSEEEIFEMSPFVVDGSADEGYRATSTLAGTRLRTSLKDVGAAISVVTADLMDDLGATDLESLLLYTTNTEIAGVGGSFTGTANGTGQAANSDNIINNPGGGNSRVRGMTAPDRTRDYFISAIPLDRYNMDRVDISRGANSILFGLGSPSGVVNQNLKAANLKRNFGEIRFKLGSGSGSDYSYRTTVDYNRVLMDDRLAVRIALLDDEKRFQQDPAYRDTKRAYGTFTFQPWKGGTFKGNFESGTVRSNNPDPLAPKDSLSNYLTTIADYQAELQRLDDEGLITANNLANLQKIADNPESGWDLENWNLPLYHDPFNRAIKDVATFLRPQDILNGNGEFLGQGGANIFKNIAFVFESPEEAESAGGFIAVVRGNDAANHKADSNGDKGHYFDYGLANGLVSGYGIYGDGAGNVTGRYTGNIAGGTNMDAPANIGKNGAGLEYQSFTDRSVYDFANNLFAGTAGSQDFEFDHIKWAYDQTLFENRVGFEVAYNEEEYYSANANPFRGSNASITLDVNRTLPTGDPNPNFGRPYVVDRITLSEVQRDRHSSRITAFATLDFERDFLADSKMGGLLGKHTVSLLSANEAFSNQTKRIQEAWLSNDTDLVERERINTELLDVVVGTREFQRQAAYFTYIGPAVDTDKLIRDPASLTMDDFALYESPILNQVIPQPGGSVPINIWDPKRIGGISTYDLDRHPFIRGGSDTFSDVESRAAVLQSHWLNGHIVTTYGKREDDLVSLKQVRDDFGVFSDEIEEERVEGESESYGIVAHLPDSWFENVLGGTSLSFFYNESNNVSPETGRLDATLSQFAPPEGETTEIGFSLSTLNDKLHIRVNRYDSSATGVTSRRTGDTMRRALLQGPLQGLQLGLRNLGSMTHPLEVNENTGLLSYPHLDTYEDYVNSIAGLYGMAFEFDDLYADRPVFENDGVTPVIDEDTGLQVRESDINSSNTRMVVVDPNNPYLNVWETAESRLVFDNEGQLQEFAFSNPEGLTDTQDVSSKGYEAEIIYNPTKNWRMMLNVAQQETETQNSLPSTTDLYFGSGGFGDVLLTGEAANRNRGGPLTDPNASGTNTNLAWLESNVIRNYQFAVGFDGSPSPEAREWRANFITNYRFSEGRFKGFDIGGSLRWQDKVANGYGLTLTEDGIRIPDLNTVYYGDDELSVGLRFGYGRRIKFGGKDVNWRLSINADNVNIDDDDLIVVTTQPDGSPAQVRVAPPRTWSIENSFKF